MLKTDGKPANENERHNFNEIRIRQDEVEYQDD
jgi:hypothetical protein